ncbi:unnamed protein product, partial [Anisakis simplex]|uniref:GT23 domain-containing protein n=1 Tax=Anisakis simplex TaxID=6269 RepID=A0A0M3JMM3_ANISI
ATSSAAKPFDSWSGGDWEPTAAAAAAGVYSPRMRRVSEPPKFTAAKRPHQLLHQHFIEDRKSSLEDRRKSRENSSESGSGTSVCACIEQQLHMAQKLARKQQNYDDILMVGDWWNVVFAAL